MSARRGSTSRSSRKPTSGKAPKKGGRGREPRSPRSARSTPPAETGRKSPSPAGRPATGKAESHPKKSPAAARRVAMPPPAPKAVRTPRTARKGVSSREAAVLLGLEDLLKKRIVGKDEAVTRVASTIRTRRAMLDFKPGRPDGSFLLAGPPGVGKNEFAYAVAEALYGDEGAVASFDMSDYQDEEAEDRLKDTQIAGRDDIVLEGTLTAAVRANPRAILLLHGLEKCHPLVQRLLYQILDQGFVSDADGTVSFAKTIIFATTRFSEEDLKMGTGIGFARGSATLEERLQLLLRMTLLPELVGAFNQVIFLGNLSVDDVRNIARFKVQAVLERLRSERRSVQVSDTVLDAFIQEDEVQKLGATRLNRTLEEKLFHPLALFILEHRSVKTIRVDLEGDRLVIH